MTPARRYRLLLLLAYPRRYRRHRGEEMLSALLDAADAGDPAGRRETAGLLLGGLRCRFRLTGGAGVRVAAVLGALLCGTLLAAGGQWIGWQTAGPLPGARDAAAIASAVPLARNGKPERHDFRYGSPGHYVAGAGGSVRWVRTPEPGPGLTGFEEYDAGSVRYRFEPARHDPVALTRVVADRLRSRGWQVDVAGDALTARRGGVHLSFAAQPATLRIDRAQPYAVVVCAVLGLLLGAAFGWLAVGWAGRRLAARSLAVRVPAVVLGAAGLLALLPAWCFGLVDFVGWYRDDGQFGPLWLGLVTYGSRPLAALGALAVLAALVLARLPGAAHRATATRLGVPG